MSFKFQSDSINTGHETEVPVYEENFKFQSDSINTIASSHGIHTHAPLNSNLILLILDPQHRAGNERSPLNSNLILLIQKMEYVQLTLDDL